MFVSLMTVSSLAAKDYSQAEIKAEALKTLGLFKGVSETDFDLERAPTRAEALVMFIRMMGSEKAALSCNYRHPFTDVPSWCDRYVAYAYKNGYTFGMSETIFGSSIPASAATYLTFILRALNYEEGYGKDFRWDDPFTFAWSRDILPSEVDTDNFERADAVLVSWAALSVPMNMGNAALAELMVMDGVFTQSQLDQAWNMVENGSGSSTVNGIKMGSYVCTIDSNSFIYLYGYRPVITLKSDGSFSLIANIGEGMSTSSGHWETAMNDSEETLLYLFIDKGELYGSETGVYGFSVYKDTIYVEDGSLGITPVYSEFVYDPRYVPEVPAIGDTSGGETSECGKKLEGDDAAATNLRDTILSDPAGTLVKLGIVNSTAPKRPDETTALLSAIRSDQKKMGTNVVTNGSLTEIYRYWGNREQLEQYSREMLDHYDVAVTNARVKELSDYFAEGKTLNQTTPASMGKPMFGYYFCEFWNEQTDSTVVGGVKLSFGNVRRGLYRDKNITLSELPTAEKNSFIVILPEEHLIVAYNYNDQRDGADWMADCWVLACDVDDAGKLQCHGVFCESFSNGMRLFCEATYSISVS